MTDIPREDALAHFGVKGMKWGVRKDRVGSNKGGGTVKVKYRPTYTVEERRDAMKAVKQAKKTGKKAVDSQGFDQTRIAKIRTPQRRLVNAFLGTLPSNTAEVGTIAGFAASALAKSPELALGTAAVGGTALTITGLYDIHRTFFVNLARNPSVKLKTDLTPDEMAKYTSGKTITKEILSKRGSATISIGKTSAKVTARDREGRNLGGQVLERKPPKPPKPAAKK